MEKNTIKISEVDSLSDIEQMPEESNIILDDHDPMQDEEFWEDDD